MIHKNEYQENGFYGASGLIIGIVMLVLSMIIVINFVPRIPYFLGDMPGVLAPLYYYGLILCIWILLLIIGIGLFLNPLFKAKSLLGSPLSDYREYFKVVALLFRQSLIKTGLGTVSFVVGVYLMYKLWMGSLNSSIVWPSSVSKGLMFLMFCYIGGHMLCKLVLEELPIHWLKFYKLLHTSEELEKQYYKPLPVDNTVNISPLEARVIDLENELKLIKEKIDY
jgi:hypothetical protein